MNNLLNFLNDFSIIIAPIFYNLVFMSLSAMMIGIIIIFLRKFVDNKISPKWKYIIWSLVFISLLMPYRPQSDISLTNNISKIDSVSFREDYNEIAKIASVDSYTPQQIEVYDAQYKQALVNTVVFDISLPLLWFVGSVISLLFIIVSKFRLDYKINASKIETSENTLIIFNECKKTLNIDDNIKIIVQDYIQSPAIIGLFNPKIILPSYTLSDSSLRFVLLHELVHYKRKDMLINYLMISLSFIYWFNPFIFLLFKLIREDMEILNDDYVLRYVDNKKGYAVSLIEVLSNSHNIAFTPRLLCMVDSKKNTKRRISMMNLKDNFKKNARFIAIISISFICVVSILFLTQNKDNIDIPNVYLHDNNGNVYELNINEYLWDYQGNKGIVDTIDYTESHILKRASDYDSNSTIVIDNENISSKDFYLSSSNDISSKTLPFKIMSVVYEKESDHMINVNQNFSDDYAYIDLNEDADIYYIDLEMEFEQGSVMYGLKVDKTISGEFRIDIDKQWPVNLDNYIDVDKLMMLDISINEEYKFDERKILLQDSIDNEIEHLAYNLYYYTQAAEFEKLDEINEMFSGTTSLKNDLQDGMYYELINIHELSVLTKDEVYENYDSFYPDLSKSVYEHNLQQFAIASVDVSFEYSEIMKSRGPQNEEGRYLRYYLIGKTENNDEYKIYEVYWG